MALTLAIGAVFSAFSEFWFYQVDISISWLELILIYGLLGYFFLLTLRMFQVRAFTGFFVAAGIFGFAVEGLPVPVLYLNLPFSIAWTSLGWHALFTVGIGFFLYRRVMSSTSARNRIALNLAIGIGLGVWNAYTWNAVENDAAQTLTYDWNTPFDFAGQFLFGWVLFVSGHLALDRFPPRATAPSRKEFLTFLAIIVALFLLGPFLAFFPFSLIFPFLLLISYASLGAGTRSEQTDWLRRVFEWRIPTGRYVVSLLIPLSAISVYAIFHAFRLEFATNVPVAGTAVLVSTLFWFWSLLKANHSGPTIPK